MITFLFIYLLVWIIYNIIIYKRYGLLDSVSASHYALTEENKNYGWIFTIFSWSYAISAMILATTGLMFFAGAFICLVGVAANYRTNSMDKICHGYFAKIAVMLSQLSIIIDYHLWWVSLISISLMGLIYLSKIKNITYWVEQVAWISIGFTLLKSIW